MIQILSNHAGDVTSVAFNPHGTLLASGSYDDTVLFWTNKADSNASSGGIASWTWIAVGACVGLVVIIVVCLLLVRRRRKTNAGGQKRVDDSMVMIANP